MPKYLFIHVIVYPTDIFVKPTVPGVEGYTSEQNQHRCHSATPFRALSPLPGALWFLCSAAGLCFAIGWGHGWGTPGELTYMLDIRKISDSRENLSSSWKSRQDRPQRRNMTWGGEIWKAKGEKVQELPASTLIPTLGWSVWEVEKQEAKSGRLTP